MAAARTNNAAGVTRMFVTANGSHWYKLDGRRVSGVTTIIGGGIPKPNLKSWGERVVAEFAIDRRDDWLELERDEALALLKGAPFRDTDRAAKRGTEVHRLAEQLLAGHEVDVPDELAGHVESYMRFVADWRPQCLTCEAPLPCGCGEEFVEAVVVNRAYQYMGRLDCGLILPGLGRTLVDVKTTRSGVFAESSLQLAAYRFAETWLDNDAGIEYEMPTFDACAVLWIRADGYDLVPVQADADTWRTFLYAQQIAQWAHGNDEARRTGEGSPIGDPLPKPAPPRLEVVS